MVNTKSKGSRNRLKIIKALKDDGYTVDIVEKTNRFASPKDMFGLFDLVALKDCYVFFIQVASNKPHPHGPLKEFAEQYYKVDVQQYVVHNGGKIVLYNYLGNSGYNTITNPFEKVKK